jgi:hypothetical protein
LSVLAGQYLNLRIESRARLAAEVAARQAVRSKAEARIGWTFRVAGGRKKLGRLNPKELVR